MEKNQFRLADVILSVICVVFVAEAAAPVASIGNSQYFWWIFMILAFLLPYGLIAAELGTAYAGDGGLYDWIHAAYPNGKWAARASWYYWINFPLWMASLAVMCPELITFITGRSLGTFGSLVVELLFIWIVTLIACYPVCDSIIILNVSAVIKIVLALLVGGLGVWYISRYGFVNDMSARTFLPSFDLNSLSYISVIIFNFLGFEVVCTYANNMSDPKKQIPQSIVTGGIVIAAKNAEALRILNDKIRGREIEKSYLCVVCGRPKPAEGRLEGYLFKDAVKNQVYVTKKPQPGAKTAVTEYRTLCSARGLSLVECRLLTGRTHQIRAQMAAAGCPLLGDGKYGRERINRTYGETGQMLYSYKLTFTLPTDAGRLEYLRGRTFQVQRVPFAEKYFPDFKLS